MEFMKNYHPLFSHQNATSKILEINTLYNFPRHKARITICTIFETISQQIQ